jgi:4-hydroxybenzoate polyprenyltransferase
VRSTRPKQWVKQVLVVAAPAAAGVLDHPRAIWLTVVAAVTFTMAAGGTYLLNDASDVEADRRHPTKRHRPLASGQVPLWLGGRPVFGCSPRPSPSAACSPTGGSRSCSPSTSR